jgi:hypothetical protein
VFKIQEKNVIMDQKISPHYWSGGPLGGSWLRDPPPQHPQFGPEHGQQALLDEKNLKKYI